VDIQKNWRPIAAAQRFSIMSQSVNHMILYKDRTRALTSRHACMEIRFFFKEKTGSLSEGYCVAVTFISMA
jgi:hypothetical protein